MVLSADLINLVLYCVQQLGVTLGVGAETILLVAYVMAIRDGVVDAKEAQFSRAVRGVLNLGLLLIILSGMGITVLQVIGGGEAVVLTPAYLFKWVLIVLALVLTALSRKTSQSVLEGVAGGTWYALFLVHILAPQTTWANLLTLYGVWLVGFSICWWALVALLYGKKDGSVTITPTKPRPVITPVPMATIPKPVAPVTVPVVKAATPSVTVIPASAPRQQPSFAWLRKLFAKKAPPQEEPEVIITPRLIPIPTPAPVVHPSVALKPTIPPAPVLPKPPITPTAPIPQRPLGVLQTAPPPMVAPLEKIVPPPALQPPPPPPVPSQSVKIADPDQNPGLPAIRVMPKTQADLAMQNRASVVRFN